MKNNVRNLLIVILAVLFLPLESCKKPDSVTVTPAEVEISKSGGKKTLTVTANCPWSISAPQWLECEPMSGSGSSAVTIRAPKNEGLERSGSLIFTAGDAATEVKVIQGGVDFSASQVSFEFDSDGTPISFTIISTYDWMIDIPSDASWCTASPMSGKAGETEVTLTPEPITDRNPRPATFLTVNYGTSFSMLTVSQTLPNDSPEAPLLISPSDNASDVKINANFTWLTASDPDGDSVSYNLMVSSDNGKSWESTSTTKTTSKTKSLLSKSTSYMWKVVAVDAFGAKSESEVRIFTTGDGGAYKDGEVSVYRMESAGAPKPIHLIFMGDGFVEDDYTEGGAFDQAVETAVNAFFGLEPYATYQDYFRISTVAVYSQERGATVKQAMSNCPAQTKNTAFAATLEGGNSTGTSCNYDKVFQYAMKVPGVTNEDLQNTTVFLLINLDVYAGTCMMENSGRSISMCPMGKSSFEPVVCHEGGGHGFGRLLDEYRYYDSSLPSDQVSQILAWRQTDPYYGYNIDVTGSRDDVHWSHYFTRSGYDAVGLYEGGCLYYYGVWRPEYISCMEDNRYYYNAPSREAIVRRIMKASGKTFSMDDFIAKDVVRSASGAPETKSDYVSAPFIPLAPPILVER